MHFQHTGGANPVSLRQAAPSRGRGENVGRFECIDTSFLWKEVSAGRRLGAQSGVKKERLKSTIYESTRAPLTRSPFPNGEGLGEATLRVDFYKGRCPKVVFKSWVTSHNNDTSRPLEMEVPQRDFRVWPNPKRRLACPLRCLPVWPNGPRRRRRIECLEEAQLYAAV